MDHLKKMFISEDWYVVVDPKYGDMAVGHRCLPGDKFYSVTNKSIGKCTACKESFPDKLTVAMELVK
jgi:hypothetical protein